jgi:hypothetical protein
VADIITRPTVGPTRSGNEAGDRLDAAVPNPDEWCITGTIEHFMSSKLYPVDVVDGMVFGISLTAGAMSRLPFESLEASAILVSGYHYQARWFYTDGPYDDSIEASADMVSGYWYQARWFYVDGPYDDSIEASADLVSGYYDNKLVEADTPDSLLLLSCHINSSCSMTGI